MNVLMLSPEPPYPLHGGGAYRIASLLNYFAQRASVDLLLLSDSGKPALIPDGLVRNQWVIQLTAHKRTLLARYWRNAGRAIRGVPPLIDRLAGLEKSIGTTLQGRSYDLGIIEHFWCAPYLSQLQKVCHKTVLDLHNVESVLHDRCGAVSRGLVRAGHARFALSSRALEASLLPRFTRVLVTSEADRLQIGSIAPAANTLVYPNSFPLVDLPSQREEDLIVFSGNFEYHPNIDAARFLAEEIWPSLHERHPAMKLRLVGRGDEAVRHIFAAQNIRHASNFVNAGVEFTGPVKNAFDEIARAKLVIAPLRAGSGTRIKILEAWAAGRCVVATPAAAEGLDARDRTNLRLASDAVNFVRIVDRLLADPDERERLGQNGRATFEAQYSWPAAWRKLDALDLQLTQNFGLNRYTENS
jgi:glycosyltransferase involved in cell wall biosynthesis